MRNTFKRCKPLLGTYVEVSLSGEVNDIELITISNDIFSEIRRIEQIMSFHDPFSELSQLNKAMLAYSNRPLILSNELLQVINLAMDLYHKSVGYYDIAIAPRLVIDAHLPNHLGISRSNILGNSSNIKLHRNTLVNNKPICIDLGGIAKGYAVDCAVKKIPKHVEFCIMQVAI